MSTGKSQIDGYGDMHLESSSKGPQKPKSEPKSHQEQSTNIFQQQFALLKEIGKSTADSFADSAKKMTQEKMPPVEHEREVQRSLGELRETTALIKAEKAHLDKLMAIDVDTNLAKAVQLNASWVTDTSDIISQGMHLMSMRNEKVHQVQQNLKSLEAKARSQLGTMYVHAYAIALEKHQDADKVLLDAFDQLGNDVPDAIKNPLKEAKSRALASGKLDAFQKAYLSDDYTGALQAVVEKHKKIDSYGPVFHGLSATDITVAYTESIGARAAESKNISYRLNTNSPGYQKLREGYIPIAFNTDTPENAYGFTTLAKKMPDGSLSVFVFSQDGRQISGEPTEKMEYTITEKSAKESEQDETKLEGNFEKLVGKMKSFKKIGEASSVMQNEFATIKSLFDAGKNGKMTSNFVDGLRTVARSIEGSNALSILRASLPDVKRDLDLLKSIPAGERGPFENKIADLEASYRKLTTVVEGHQIENFCEKILNPAFTPDTASSWFIKEGLVTLGTIVGGVAMAAITFGTGGLGGVALTAAMGSIGGIIGREAGNAYSEIAGSELYGEGYSNKSLLGSALSGEKAYKDGEFRDVTLTDVAQIYGKEFVGRVAGAMAGYGFSKLTGPLLEGLADAYRADPGVRGSLIRLIDKLSSMGSKEVEMTAAREFVDKLGQKMAKRIRKKVAKEVLKQLEGVCDEVKDFAKESLIDAVSTQYSMIDERMFLDGNDLVREMVVKTNDDSEESVIQVAQTLKKQLEDKGYQVIAGQDGGVFAEKKMMYGENGETMKINLKLDRSA